jgi:hypothetical protein
MVTEPGKLPSETAGDRSGMAGSAPDGVVRDATSAGHDVPAGGDGETGNGYDVATNGTRNGTEAKQPSVVAGMTLLGLAGVLMVVVLINPPMPGWLRVVIVIAALLTVAALLAYALLLFRSTKRGGGRG